MLRCQVVGQDVRCNLMTIKKQHVRFDSSMSVVIDDRFDPRMSPLICHDFRCDKRMSV